MSLMNGLLGNLLKQGASQALRTVRERAGELFGQLEEHVAAWTARLALKYAVAVALGVGALGSLSSAAREGLIAAGLPPWAAHLLLGVLMAAGAALLFKKPSRSAGSKTEPEGDKGGRGSPSEPTFAVHIHTGRGPEPPGPRRGRSGRPRVVRVKHLQKGWQVESGLHHRKKRLFENKRLAMKAARAAARKGSAQVVVLGTGRKARRVVERSTAGVEHAA